MSRAARFRTAVALDLIVDGLAVYRCTRLLTKDTILDGPRDGIVKAAYRMAGRFDVLRTSVALDVPGAASEFVQGDEHAPKLATLITCRWCMGVYVGFAAVAARRLAPRAWEPVARALAFSAAAALLAGLEDG